MTTEAVVNGSHEPDLDQNMKDEKILKPRKPILSNEHEQTVFQNGNNENGSVSDNGENDNVENGYEGEIENGEASKANKKTLRHRNIQEKREVTPNRQSLPREAKTVKESTPKPESPTKRELRQREGTPRKSTPKPETPGKREIKRRGTPSKINSEDIKLAKYAESKSKGNENMSEAFDDKQSTKMDFETNKKYNKEIEFNAEESVILIEESTIEDSSVVSIAETDEKIEIKDKPEEKRLFSSFRRKSSLEIKDACEASSSSPSVICLDSPSFNEEQVLPTKDIKGRKPINSFSRFPGRNVSITSLDKSLKRKADDSFGEEDRKRFAGETASGSEKSPGWLFFSPSFTRTWSPAQSAKTHLPTSTPFHQRNEQDSMAVNFDSKTRLDLDDSIENEEDLKDASKQKASTKWCTIM